MRAVKPRSSRGHGARAATSAIVAAQQKNEETAMPSRHLVDPQITPLIEQLPGFGFTHESLAQTRAMMLEMGAAGRPPTPDDVEVSEHLVPGPKGAPDVRVVVSKPKAKGASRPAVLHVHGGGYVLGAPEMGLTTDATYVTQFGAVVVSVDYRLAPETPHPGPVEDCYAGLAWLFAQAGALGIDTSRVAVSGESAGGGMAAGLVLLARDRGDYKIAFQHLIFPMLDDRTAVDKDPSPYHGQFVWTREDNVFGWTALLGHAPGGSDVSPYAAAARAMDLAGLPPTYMICGALDLFLEEDMDYARRLIRAGVPTEFHVYPGAPHAFMFVESAEVTKIHVRDSMAAMKRALLPA
jgi:acetyl esterase/lipase